MGDLEKGVDDSSDPTRVSTSDAEEQAQSQTPEVITDSKASPTGDATVPYGPQSVIVDWDGPHDPEFPSELAR